MPSYIVDVELEAKLDEREHFHTPQTARRPQRKDALRSTRGKAGINMPDAPGGAAPYIQLRLKLDGDCWFFEIAAMPSMGAERPTLSSVQVRSVQNCSAEASAENKRRQAEKPERAPLGSSPTDRVWPGITARLDKPNTNIPGSAFKAAAGKGAEAANAL